MEHPTTQYYIALSKIPLIGSQVARNLISYCGGVSEVFHTPLAKLLKIPGVGQKIIDNIKNHRATAWALAEKEMQVMEKNNIQCIPYTHERYPNRLLFCQDAPLYIFVKGETDFNTAKVISFVGTRQASDYGREMTEALIKDLEPHNVLIVSGLAYGIDIAAHKAALKYNLPTVCVLAHGFSKIYPHANTAIANKMLSQGGAWISEYTFDTDADRQNFPSRNRIVAGMSDAVVVVESALKGGSLITAEIALSYQRELFAVPGRVQDTKSQGCNHLIKTQKALLCNSAKDILNTMGWDSSINTKTKQTTKDYSFLEKEELHLVDILKGNSNIMQIDLLIEKSEMQRSAVISILLGMELKGIVRNQKGSCFELI